MNLRRLFSINIFFAIFFGVVCSLFPRWSAQLYGLAADETSIWLCRLVGGSILGYATLMWFGWQRASGDARRAIALALLTQDAIGFIASLEIQLSGKINALGWSNLLIYGLFALAYAYFLFFKPDVG
jgi:hypothetical protein